MAKKAAGPAWRFLADNSLVLPDGVHLFPGPALEQEAASEAAKSMPVLWHSYLSRTEDISGDHRRLRETLEPVDTTYELETYVARIYSAAERRVLVLERQH